MSTQILNLGVAIQHASQLERLLEEKFSAELQLFQQENGKIVNGLGDKVKVLDSHFSSEIKSDLWVIVRIRNKVAHEANFGSDSIEDYVERCNRVTRTLNKSPDSKTQLINKDFSIDDLDSHLSSFIDWPIFRIIKFFVFIGPLVWIGVSYLLDGGINGLIVLKAMVIMSILGLLPSR